MPPGEDDLAELMQRILGACDVLDARLDAVEAGIAIPAKLSDGTSGGGVEPVQGEWQSPTDPRDWS